MVDHENDGQHRGDNPDDGSSKHLSISQIASCNIPEDIHICAHYHKNLKSHKIIILFQTPQSQTTAAFGFTPIANMTSPTPVMMSGMMSPPPMMVPTIPVYAPAGILLTQYVFVAVLLKWVGHAVPVVWMRNEYHLGDLGIDWKGNIKVDMRVWIGCIWLRIRSTARLLIKQ